ncbi:glycoside hydrolase family 31 [Echinicola strongylocentroti]|uniref:Glycoside hydrolase family 31 n=1 Tax=Echinicola strongylocentroti TaxID=1795355 RepID=A0A2Z4IP60_9BACT|nr:glycoside hydrolase family 31 protein [Echinicola strongylocentroti]AWW32336.1 glycoside hydrolase family 31 [Echinicola strongylocentroti]
MTTVATSVTRAQNQSAGKVLSWEPTTHGITGRTEASYFKISLFTDTTVRIQLSRYEQFSSNPYSVVQSPKGISVNVSETPEALTLETTELKIVLTKNEWALSFYDQQGNLLNQDDPAFGVSWLGTEVTNYKKLQPDEKFIGLGEKTGGIDRAGQAFTNWNTDYFAYGVNDDPLYMSIPFYIGIHGERAYGIFFDNTHKTTFNFGASNRRFSYFSAEDGDMDYYFLQGNTVAEIISGYTSLTGKMSMPPLWALGFQQCRYSYYPESEVFALADNFRDRDMPADVIYLDIHHMEKYKVFTFDGEKFPDPKSMIQTLKAKGFRVVVIMDPGIKVEKDYLPYQEGKDKGLFLNYPDGETYEGQVWPGWCAFPDFTSAKTRQWWAEKMAFYTDAGVDGFWTDMNEPASWGQHTPNLINFDYEGEQVSHRKARNVYGMQMARAAQEGAFKNGKERPFTLTRAGFSGIQRFAAAWTGDNVSSEEHMMAGIRLVNSLGISGVSFAGYDVGGFCGEASKSLFARWMSIAAFSPLYRAHSMINSNDAEPWAFGEEVEEISKNYLKLRYQMLPLLYTAFHKSSQDGLPLAKSLTIDYPFDENIYDGRFQNQYLFCDSLLVAPAESHKEITKAYLPEGNWYYFFHDQSYLGGQEIYVDTPINYLPVFVKGGSIVPLQSPVSHTAEQHDSILRLHVYKGEGISSYFHYEDDGRSLDYKKGGFYKREILLDSDRQTLRLTKPTGDFASRYKQLSVIFHGFEINEVTSAGEKLPLTRENIAFLHKISDFDPLPDNRLPYHEIAGLPTVTLPHHAEEIILTFGT